MKVISQCALNENRLPNSHREANIEEIKFFPTYQQALDVVCLFNNYCENKPPYVSTCQVYVRCIVSG